ncbi:MAG: HAD-IIA family hydrolase [Acidaminococcaceae bacterium]|jgi:NagD protein|nr:HAD-IIA family hydrolase [Acidaminococcaceae bacterium]
MNYEEKLAELRTKKGIISDMDGVIYHGNQLLPGVREFVDWLYKEKKEFLFLTNASERTPLELKQKLARLGLDVDESHFYTSAMATAKFLDQQAPGCSAYVIGSAGLLNALHDVGITMNDVNPDYVVVGETSAYNFMMLTKAMQLVEAGAKLIATNSDISGPGETGNIPACKALVAPLELTTGRHAYFVGKPNPLIMRTGLKLLGVHSAEAAMIGDNMNTDIIAGIETGLMSVLVLSGVSTKEGIKNYAYQPNLILNNVGEIVPKKV